MVNNFELIRENLKFPNERSFYFVQILKRSKDNPEQKAYKRPIECFYIRSLAMFDRYMPRIIEKCEKNNARAYIKMNPLDILNVGQRTIMNISNATMQHDWWHIISAFNSACGQGGMAEEDDDDVEQTGNHGMSSVYADGCPKLWLIDVDNQSDDEEENVRFRNEVKDYINSLQPLKEKGTGEPITNKVMLEVPTKNGCHFLCTHFDLKAFRDKYRSEKDKKSIEGDDRKVVDYHKEGNTILYIP